MPPAGYSRLIQRCCANAAIVALLAIIVSEAFRFVPDRLRALAVVAANRLGIGQGAWVMFAPPDQVNHRVRAEITLQDGRLIVHPFPHPAEQSSWQRFVGHRRSEYVDNAVVFGRQYRELWEGCADYLARQYAHQGGGVAQVRIVVEFAHIPAPASTPWPPRDEPLPFDDGEVVVRRKYR
ncbi:MAG TPA: hypothetical protein VMP01_22530 [Pirellulaceae bacterium]|nr:hypothetical protein [Pirellulaceae bacterium]